MNTKDQKKMLLFLEELDGVAFSGNMNIEEYEKIIQLYDCIDSSSEVGLLLKLFDSLQNECDPNEIERFAGSLRRKDINAFFSKIQLGLLNDSFSVVENYLLLVVSLGDDIFFEDVMRALSRKDASFEGLSIATEYLEKFCSDCDYSFDDISEILPSWFKDASRKLDEREYLFGLEKALKEASSCLMNSNYDKVVQILAPYEKDLSVDGLRKLKIARMKSR